jgi:hypothetical protein
MSTEKNMVSDKVTKTELYGFTPQANYTNWVTAACWWT